MHPVSTQTAPTPMHSAANGWCDVYICVKISGTDLRNLRIAIPAPTNRYASAQVYSVSIKLTFTRYADVALFPRTHTRQSCHLKCFYATHKHTHATHTATKQLQSECTRHARAISTRRVVLVVGVVIVVIVGVVDGDVARRRATPSKHIAQHWGRARMQIIYFAMVPRIRASMSMQHTRAR